MDELLNAVQQQALDQGYTVYGELGRENDADVWYLARDIRTGTLVAMRLFAERVEADGSPEYGLEVAKELNASVSVGISECPECATPMRRWGRFCTRCGANLGEKNQPDDVADRETILARVRQEAGDVYDVLGEMPWTGGGAVFFALERASGRLVRLRIKSEAEGGSVGETRAMMPLKARVSAGYMTQLFAAAQPPSTPLPKLPPPAPEFTPSRITPRESPPPRAQAPIPSREVVRPSPTTRSTWSGPLAAREWVMLIVIVILLAIVVAQSR